MVGVGGRGKGDDVDVEMLAEVGFGMMGADDNATSEGELVVVEVKVLRLWPLLCPMNKAVVMVGENGSCAVGLLEVSVGCERLPHDVRPLRCHSEGGLP